MEKFKDAVFENEEFDYRGLSLLIAYFAHFWFQPKNQTSK